MKTLKLVAGLSALLLAAHGCSSPAPSNGAANTAASNAANRAANASNAAASNTANTAANANASQPNATASAAQDFTLVNQTGVEIDKVYISPHDTDDWEEDILGKDTLPSGQSVEIKFVREETAALWDLRVEDDKGGAIVWENLNLLKISKLTLHYDKETGKATADAE